MHLQTRLHPRVGPQHQMPDHVSLPFDDGLRVCAISIAVDQIIARTLCLPALQARVKHLDVRATVAKPWHDIPALVVWLSLAVTSSCRLNSVASHHDAECFCISF